MGVQVTPVFSAGGCGRQANALDWHQRHNYGAMACGATVALLAPIEREQVSDDDLDLCQLCGYFRIRALKVLPNAHHSGHKIARTAHWHQVPVTCVKWLIEQSSSDQGAALLCSGDACGSVCVWRVDGCDGGGMLKLLWSLEKTHEDPVLYCCGAQLASKTVLLTSGADGAIKIWSCLHSDNSSPQPTTAPKLAFSTAAGPKSPVTMAMGFSVLSESLLIATGGHDSVVRLWLAPVGDLGKCQPVLTLAGHADWIRSIAFKPFQPEDGCLYLASASQDRHIRIWKIAKQTKVEKAADISTKSRCFDVPCNSEKRGTYVVALEAVLSGHEDWVYSISWHPNGRMELSSCGMDRCTIVWRPTDQNENGDNECLWLEATRLGVAGGQQQHAGYYGVVYTDGGRGLMANAYNGGLHHWRRSTIDACDFSARAPLISGHSAPVTDLDWDPNGGYLVTCAGDMTTRLWAPCCCVNDNEGDGGAGRRLVQVVEFARPQVHGYGMQCVKCVGSGTLVSAGEEKLLRAFVAPSIFAENWRSLAPAPRNGADPVLEVPILSLARAHVCLTFGQRCGATFVQALASRPVSATGAGVPSLGLSNKAIFENDSVDAVEDGDEDRFRNANLHFAPVLLRAPPTEDHLMQNTLWPEEHKLYGHGFEVYTVTCNRAGTLLASSCKASQPTHAAIHLWRFDGRLNTWRVANKILAHKLTVTSLRFRPGVDSDDGGELLLSVSRDRTWALHAVKEMAEAHADCEKVAGGGGHSRVIWDCAWTMDGRHFVTVGRDKKVIAWRFSAADTGKTSEIVCDCAVTAVDVTQTTGNGHLVAVGLENGRVELHRLDADGILSLCQNLDPALSHCGQINRLRFRPVNGHWPSHSCDCCDEKSAVCTRKLIVCLASASEDRFVKVCAIVDR